MTRPARLRIYGLSAEARVATACPLEPTIRFVSQSYLCEWAPVWAVRGPSDARDGHMSLTIGRVKLR